MDENPYKAPGEKGATPMAPEPQNEKFWTVTFYIGACLWIGSTGGMIFAGLSYDPPPPDVFWLAWGWMALLWSAGAAAVIVAIIKLQPPA